jgi:hypothetical protein
MPDSTATLRKMWLVAASFLLLAPRSLPQTKTPGKSAGSSAAADRLGLPCPRILQLSSSDWVARFNQAKGETSDGTARAIAVYGKCYDDRTDALAASLARKGAGPSKKTRADFSGFAAALQSFVGKAFAEAQPPTGAPKTDYVDLYEKQFRYEFYCGYAEKNLNPTLTPDQNEQFAKAKNRFGELLGLLPEEKAHEVHEAFGDIIGTHQISLMMKLMVYRFAIFVLEPPSEAPFAPPPF